MPRHFTVAPRPIAPEDAGGAHRLLVSRFGGTPHLDRAVEILHVAARGSDQEHRAYVVAQDGVVAGIALFGIIAGTDAGHRLHALVASSVEDEVGDCLLEAVVGTVAQCQGRFIVAELADEPALAATIALLRQRGFAEAGRIPDYFREGVPLVILRRDLL